MISAAPSWSRTRRGDLHDLGIRPPLEHRADRGGAHQRRQQHLEARRRFGWRRRIPVCRWRRSRPCARASRSLVFTTWCIGSTSKYSLAKMIDGPSGTSSMLSCQPMLRTPDSVERLFFAQHGIDLDQMDAERLIEAAAAPATRAAHPPSWCRGPVQARSAAATAANRSPSKPTPPTARAIRRTSG